MTAAAQSARPTDADATDATGPAETVNAASLGTAWLAAGASKADLHRVLRSFNANAGEFRAAAEKLDEDD